MVMRSQMRPWPATSSTNKAIFNVARRDRLAERRGGLPATGLRRQTRRCAQQVEALLRAHRRAGSFLESPPLAGDARHHRPACQRTPRHADRPLQAAAADRRRGLRRRLHGRADRAGPPPGGPQGDQAGHGHAAGDRPLRGRAAGPGGDGPSEHRPGAGRRERPNRAGRTS